MSAAAESPIFLPRREVERRVGLGRSAIYDRMARGAFPQPVHDEDSRAVWWVESEVTAWQQARINARNMGQNMGTDSDEQEKAA